MQIEHITRHGVIVVDPNAQMSALIVVMLRTLKRRDVREAGTAALALAELHRRPFEVLLIEGSHADLDAVALVGRLRRAEGCPNRDTAVVMMSAMPDAARIAAARDAGVTEFLRKPFSAQHLATRLEAIRANPRPFVAAAGFAGPDRRRRDAEFKGEERRGPGAGRKA